jgi:hypothetical protein
MPKNKKDLGDGWHFEATSFAGTADGFYANSYMYFIEFDDYDQT